MARRRTRTTTAKKKKSSRRPIALTKSVEPESAGTSRKFAEQTEHALSYVLGKYLQAFPENPNPCSFKDMMPELVIPATLRELFPGIITKSHEGYFGFQAMNIRRAFRECLAAEGRSRRNLGDCLDDTVSTNDFRLLKAIVLGCYPPPLIAAMNARLLANGESANNMLKGFTLTCSQHDSLLAPPNEINQAMNHLMYVADVWPHVDLRNPSVLDRLGWCLQTVTQVFRERDADKAKSLDVAFGFSASGRGRSTERKKTATKHEWDDNCFDIHILHLAGDAISSACERYARDPEPGKQSGSGETFEKRYYPWREDPVTAVRLHIGDRLATNILSLPDAREIIETRFPH